MNTAKNIDYPSVKLSSWLLAARPKTLIAGVSPVLLGSVLAVKYGTFNPVVALLCLLFGVSVQVGCNYFNDYFDFVNGVDTHERVGPKRAVAGGLISARGMLVGSCLVLLFALMVGCGLAFYGGFEVVVWAVLAVLCAFLYTGGPYPLGYYGYGSLFVLVFFGFVATMYTFRLQAGFFSVESALVGLAVGLLAVNIREVNDLRDCEEDRVSGKRTMVIRFGAGSVKFLYVFNLVVAYLVPFFLLFNGSDFSVVILLPLISLPIAISAFLMLFKSRTKFDYISIFMKTVKLMLLYSLILSLAIYFS